MQSISADLQEEQKRQDQLYYRKVEIAKLYWDAGEGKYKWDALENIDAYISEDHGGVSTARWKQDTRAFNEWKSPSFQVEVDNRRDYWSEIESSGIWRTGANQPYTVELTKIRVRCGQYLPDGTEEDKYVFSGLINEPIAYHDETKTATLYCTGYDEKLRRVNAELLSTLVTDELLGSDAGTEFTTANNGVGGIPPIIKKGATGSGPGAATTLKAGVDYELSDTNEKNLPLKVTLAVDLTGGNSIWGTYRYWYQDKGPSWIVEQLLILAEITSYNVDPTIFAVDVENIWPQTTKADWEAGIISGEVDLDRYDGDVALGELVVFDDFDDGSYSDGDPRTWSGNGDFSIVGTRVRGLSNIPTPLLSTPSVQAYGTWQIKMQTNWACEFHFISSSTDKTSFVGYCLRVNSVLNTCYLYRTEGGTRYELASGGTPGTTEHTYRITRNSSNIFTVYIDGAQIMSVENNHHTTSSYVHFQTVSNGSAQISYFDDVRTSGAVLPGTDLYAPTGYYETQILDTGEGNPTNWGLLIYSVTVPAGTSISFETWSSGTADFSADNDPAGYVAIGVTGQINSAVKRYLRVRALFTASAGYAAIPRLHDLTVYYYTSTITIPLVNLTGMNVEQGIQRCAEMPAYEIGFDVDESYFYRQRTSAGAPVLTIDSKTNLEKELSFNSGTDKRKNVIDVTFGPYRTVIDPDTKGEDHPHSKDREGEKKYTVSGSTLLPPEGADVATATAETLYAYLSVAKKRARVQMKFLLQHQLGDVVKYLREHKFGRWLWGDTDRHYGDDSDPDFVYYSEAILATWNYTMRIEGIEFDTNPKQMRMRFDLVERIE